MAILVPPCGSTYGNLLHSRLIFGFICVSLRKSAAKVWLRLSCAVFSALQSVLSGIFSAVSAFSLRPRLLTLILVFSVSQRLRGEIGFNCGDATMPEGWHSIPHQDAYPHLPPETAEQNIHAPAGEHPCGDHAG